MTHYLFRPDTNSKQTFMNLISWNLADLHDLGMGCLNDKVGYKVKNLNTTRQARI